MPNQVDRAVEQYNRIAPDYAKKIADRASKPEIERFTSLLKPNSSILDVGCAAGRDSRIFKDMGFRVTGIDLSEKLIEIAKKNNPDISFFQEDMRKLHFADNNFDGIWVNAVVHHLDREEISLALSELKRVLSPNGILFISTKWGEGLWKGTDEFSVGESREFTLLKEDELIAMLDKIGLEKIDIYTKKDTTRDLVWTLAFYRKPPVK